jgi:hypothetical protein
MANAVAAVTNLFPVSVTFTPAATSHTALDCVGGAKTFQIPGGTGKMLYLTGLSFSMATTTPVTTVWTAFLFGSTPTVIADDAAFVIAAADGAKLLGYVGIPQTVDFTDVWQQIDSVLAQPKPIGPLVSDTVTVYLQNTSTITLEAVAHKLTLYFELQY